MLVIKYILHVLKYVLLLRVRQVNQESLEEMGCLAKKEYLGYQESRCVCVCVCAHVVDHVCSVHCAVFIRSSSVSSLCNLLHRVLPDLQASTA